MPIEKDLYLIKLEDDIKEVKQELADFAYRSGHDVGELNARIKKLEAFEIDGEYAINDLRDRVDRYNSELSFQLSRIIQLEFRGDYNKDYGLSLQKAIIKLMEDMELLKVLVKGHEDYLKSIDKIALHDPVKTLDNMKALYDRIDIIESMLSDVRATFVRNSHIFGDHIKRIEKLEQAYQADGEAVKALIFDGARDKERIEKLEEDIAKLKDSVASRESVADAYTQLRDSHNERLEKLEAYCAFLKINDLRETCVTNEEIKRLISENDTHCGAISVLEKKVEKLEDKIKAETLWHKMKRVFMIFAAFAKGRG